MHLSYINVLLHKKLFVNLCLETILIISVLWDFVNHKWCFEGYLSEVHSEPCQNVRWEVIQE